MAVITLPHSMTVARLTASGSNKELYTSVGSAIACWLQPAISTENQGAAGATFSKGYRCFIDLAANVRVKDRVTIDSVQYNVSGETVHKYGVWPHRVLQLEAI